MAFTFDPDLTTSRDWVRLRIGDTVLADAQFQNGTIDALLSEEGSKFKVAILLAESQGAKFSSQVNKQVGSLRIDSASRATNFMLLAKRLRAEMNRRVAPYAGGISNADIDSVKLDTDRPDPIATIGMHDFVSQPGSTD